MDCLLCNYKTTFHSNIMEKCTRCNILIGRKDPKHKCLVCNKPITHLHFGKYYYNIFYCPDCRHAYFFKYLDEIDSSGIRKLLKKKNCTFTVL